MALNYRVNKRTLTFKKTALTSRGALLTKDSWFIELFDDSLPHFIGKGECSVIPGLTPDFSSEEEYEDRMIQLLDKLVEQNQGRSITETWYDELRIYPSIWFGVEMALIDLKNNGKQQWFHSPFLQSKTQIPVNGLIWMGDSRFMNKQIEEKLNQGYNCIKLKIGSLDFNTEYRILKQLRQRYSADDLVIRVDANGAFDASNAMRYLNRLAKLKIHSIEQPVKAGSLPEMRKVCQNGAIPVALDEELIGIVDVSLKEELLDYLEPHYLVLKPGLHGGFQGCYEWIRLTEERRIGWWVTSALESNLGLNAIAQWTATLDNPLHHGLGTGALFVENLPSKLQIRNGMMYYRP